MKMSNTKKTNASSEVTSDHNAILEALTTLSKHLLDFHKEFTEWTKQTALKKKAGRF